LKKKIVISFLIVSTVLPVCAQISTHYTQFLLNEYHSNPALAGKMTGLNFLLGRRTQWIGFDHAPETNFVSFCKDLGKKNYRYYWHGIGAYIESDKFGAFNNQLITVSYALHFKVLQNYYLSFGIAGGAKNIALSNLVFNSVDPVFIERSPNVWLPVVIPGAYFYTKKFTLGIGIKDIYKNKLEQGHTTIGTGSSLPPTAYITLSRKYRSLEYDYVYIPAIQIQSSFAGIPSVSLNFIALYRGRIGMGISYRSEDAVSVILQVRVMKNIIIGLAYDYSASVMSRGYPHSLEAMIGFSPIASNDEEFNTIKTSKCPTFDF
jgi:type IX secretion system PorP/SprF family membrane protein